MTSLDPPSDDGAATPPSRAPQLLAAELQTVVDNTPAAVWSCLPDGSADFLNQRWLTFLNLAPEAAKGTGWASLLHPEDLEGHIKCWAESVRSESGFEYESRFRRHDGVYRWFLARAEPVRDETGKIQRWCGTNLDIDERKQAESALLRSERYLAEAQRLSKTGSFSWTPASEKMHWSEESFRIFELPPTSAPTLECLLERIHGDDRAALLGTFRQSEVESFDIRCRLVLPQGRIKYLRIVGRTFEVSGPVVTYAGAFMDFTEAKISEEKLHQAHAALAHVTRVITLGELAASIAHEINQPLAGLVSNGEACVRWLDREIPDLAEVRAAAEQMVADSLRAAEVLRRLRSLVKKADPAHASINFNDVVAETAPLIYRELSAHSTALVLQLGSDAPQISGDKIHLQQVIINLAVNGIQAMAGVTGRPATLTIYTGVRVDGSLLVSVEDAGTGIKPEHLEHMFDAFFSTKTSGLGMGLSICRSIIEAHGGEIRAFNNPHGGATVSFWIPHLTNVVEGV